MPDDKKPDCMTSGHCAVHGVEIERRKAVIEELKRIEVEIDKMTAKIVNIYRHIAANDAFKAQVKIAVMIISAIWVGSFIYTYNHKQDSIREHDKLHRISNDNATQISRMEGKMLVVEDRYLRLLDDNKKLISDVRSLNENVLAFMRAMENNKDKVQKVKIENYKDRLPKKSDSVHDIEY